MKVPQAIQMAKDSTFSIPSPPENTEQRKQKNVNEASTSRMISVAQQTEAVDDIIPTQSDQILDALPVISDLDIEEVIKSIQENQDTKSDKVKEFNVDALLNDPYTL